MGGGIGSSFLDEEREGQDVSGTILAAVDAVKLPDLVLAGDVDADLRGGLGALGDEDPPGDTPQLGN